MEVEHINKESKGLFKAIENGEEAGRMTYSWAGLERFIIDHTEVNAAFGGKGVGKKLVLAAIDFEREKKIKILPLCPFAKSVFDKDDSLRDVL